MIRCLIVSVALVLAACGNPYNPEHLEMERSIRSAIERVTGNTVDRVSVTDGHWEATTECGQYWAGRWNEVDVTVDVHP